MALVSCPATEKDKGQRCDVDAGMAKLLAARVARCNADAGLQIHGGSRFMAEMVTLWNSSSAACCPMRASLTSLSLSPGLAGPAADETYAILRRRRHRGRFRIGALEPDTELDPGFLEYLRLSPRVFIGPGAGFFRLLIYGSRTPTTQR